MWDKLKLVHGGDDNVWRDKAKSLRGKYPNMGMKEGENVAQYVSWIKDFVSAIRVASGVNQDSKIVSKVLRTLLPMYANKFSTF